MKLGFFLFYTEIITFHNLILNYALWLFRPTCPLRCYELPSHDSDYLMETVFKHWLNPCPITLRSKRQWIQQMLSHWCWVSVYWCRFNRRPLDGIKTQAAIYDVRSADMALFFFFTGQRGEIYQPGLLFDCVICSCSLLWFAWLCGDWDSPDGG